MRTGFNEDTAYFLEWCLGRKKIQLIPAKNSRVPFVCNLSNSGLDLIERECKEIPKYTF